MNSQETLNYNLNLFIFNFTLIYALNKPIFDFMMLYSVWSL